MARLLIIIVCTLLGTGIGYLVDDTLVNCMINCYSCTAEGGFVGLIIGLVVTGFITACDADCAIDVIDFDID